MSTAKFIRQLGGETVIYGLSATISRFIGIFLVPLYTRVFTPADYGIIALIASFDGLLTTFTVLGMDNASARWFYLDTEGKTESRKRVISTWFWFQGFVSLAITVLVIGFSKTLTNLILDSSALTGLIIITSLTWPLNTFKKVLGNWFRYQRRAWHAVSFSTASSLLTIGLTVLFVLILKRGLAGIYWAELISLGVMSIVAVVLLKDWISPGHFSVALLKPMLIFALPLVPATIAGWVTASADRFILKAFENTSEIGLYSIAATLASGMTLVIGAFQMAWGPFAFSIIEEPGAHRVYGKVFSLYFLLGSGLATALTLFSPLILYIFTTSQYAGAATSVAFLAFSSLAIGATYIAALSCGIAKRSVPSSVSIFIGAGVNTILNFILIPRLGRNGAAIATLVAYAAAAAYLFIVGQKLYPIPYRFRDAIACQGFAWLLIGVDHFLLPTWGIWPFLARLGMCFLFVPLALALGVIRTEHIRSFSRMLSQRFVWMSAK